VGGGRRGEGGAAFELGFVPPLGFGAGAFFAFGSPREKNRPARGFPPIGQIACRCRQTRAPKPDRLCEIVNRRFPPGGLGILVDPNRGATDAQRLCRARGGNRRGAALAPRQKQIGRGAPRKDRSPPPARDSSPLPPP